MPVYNGEAHIQESMGSIFKQGYKNLELIIVNDGSTDNSEKIIKSFDDSRIKYFKIENSGAPAKPRNYGIKKAAGNFVAFCDQDDIWYENKLEKQTEAYESSKNKEKIGIIVTSAVFIDEKGNKFDGNIYEKDKYLEPNIARELLLSSNFITACSALLPIHVVKETGFLNENLKGNDEYDYWLRITKNYGVCKIKEPLCAWRKSSTTLSSNKTNLYLENEKIFKKLEETEKSPMVISTHTKNLNRLFVSSILEDRSEITQDVFIKLKNRKLSLKSSIVVLVYQLNSKIGAIFVKILKKIGLIKL